VAKQEVQMIVTDIQQLEVRLVTLKLPITVSGDHLVGKLMKMACVTCTPVRNEQGELVAWREAGGSVLCRLVLRAPDMCYFFVTYFLVRGLDFATCCKYLKIAHAEIQVRTTPEGGREALIRRAQFEAF
jgi:hypothetical protein